MRALSFVLPLSLALAACTSGGAKDDPSETDTPVDTDTPDPNDTTDPTDTPDPNDTTGPTDTPDPNDTTDAVVDADGDGVSAELDCNDASVSVGSYLDDQDCDGVPGTDDCDDGTTDLGAAALDADCDGSLVDVDCDDADPAVGFTPDDADCDGTNAPLDCDDGDAGSTVVAVDQDCDGVLTLDDCDDADASVVLAADSEACVVLLGPIDIDALIGHSYALALAGMSDGPEANPRGLASIFAGLLTQGPRLTITLAGATGGLLDSTFLSYEDRGQDLCIESRSLGGFSETVGSPLVTLASQPNGGVSFLATDGVVAESEELEITGRLDPANDRIVDVRVREVTDFRSPSWAALFAAAGTDAQWYCSVLGGCAPCPSDGASFCVFTDWTGIVAERVTPDHVEVTADDVLNNPVCP